jgi:hypothetical protein
MPGVTFVFAIEALNVFVGFERHDLARPIAGLAALQQDRLARRGIFDGSEQRKS